MRVVVVLPTPEEAQNIARRTDDLLADPVLPDFLVVDDSSPGARS